MSSPARERQKAFHALLDKRWEEIALQFLPLLEGLRKRLEEVGPNPEAAAPEVMAEAVALMGACVEMTLAVGFPLVETDPDSVKRLIFPIIMDGLYDRLGEDFMKDVLSKMPARSAPVRAFDPSRLPRPGVGRRAPLRRR